MKYATTSSQRSESQISIPSICINKVWLFKFITHDLLELVPTFFATMCPKKRLQNMAATARFEFDLAKAGKIRCYQHLLFVDVNAFKHHCCSIQWNYQRSIDKRLVDMVGSMNLLDV
jgi:hypothetical protein